MKDVFDFVSAAVAEWAHRNGVTVILIQEENVLGAMIRLDGELGSKVTVGCACGLVGVNDRSINAVALGRKG